MRVALSVIFILISIVVLAQPGDPGGGGNPTVPITGIEVLIGVGGFLGLRKLYLKARPHRRPNP